MSSAVVLRDLHKRYGGVVALAGLSCEVPRGSICAVIGPNGSGKTTTFGVVAGLLAADSGTVELFGDGPFDPARHAGRLGLLPQDSVPSPHATLRQSLVYYGELQGLSGAAALRDADLWLERVRLADRARTRQRELSHGMRRRFSVAQAFIGDPELILLDEPTAGVDPELAAELRELFRQRRGLATLLISSHVLSELEGLCDYAIVIEQGRCVRQGAMTGILKVDTQVRVVLKAAPDLARLREQLPGAQLEYQPPELSVRWRETAPLEELNARLLRALLEQGAGIQSLIPGQSLEASYLEERRAAVAQRALR
ncbi:MAG TPA: ABC transporter ATP-binding protein [Polyangiaceae bacterium]|jgi:ABC-type multidrug transport system ATPase subunit|nr:ABC transporter ATP-binding protein [Polyangiaceae bacterium]